MLLAGDEFGNSQGGNNNSYCQDNETGWLDWSTLKGEEQAFLNFVLTFRSPPRGNRRIFSPGVWALLKSVSGVC
jgi:pullulanase/glycogen debranching enzyme